jgi:hypothetical protein
MERILLKGIVSWNKMEFWRFYWIDGNFLIIRWGILNFKIFVFNFKFEKYRDRRGIHSLAIVIDKCRYGENQVANPN